MSYQQPLVLTSLVVSCICLCVWVCRHHCFYVKHWIGMIVFCIRASGFSVVTELTVFHLE